MCAKLCHDIMCFSTISFFYYYFNVKWTWWFSSWYRYVLVEFWLKFDCKDVHMATMNYLYPFGSKYRILILMTFVFDLFCVDFCWTWMMCHGVMNGMEGLVMEIVKWSTRFKRTKQCNIGLRLKSRKILYFWLFAFWIWKCDIWCILTCNDSNMNENGFWNALCVFLIWI